MKKRRKNTTVKRSKKSKLTVVLTVGAVVLAIIFLVIQASSREVSISDVKTFSDGLGVPGSESKLTYSDRGVSIAIKTSILPPGHVITSWWAIFNNPDKCTHGQFGLRCGIGDLEMYGGDPEIQSSLVYAGTDLSTSDRNKRFSARLNANDLSDALFGPGLTNIQTSDIQFVIRVHGPVVPNIVDRKSRGYWDGCSNAPAGSGTPGTFACENFQFAAFQK